MDGSGTCCGPSLAPRHSYQLRLNLGSQLLDYICSHSCLPLCPHAAGKRPLLFRGRVQRSIFTIAPNGAKWESCMGLSGPIQELFVNSQRDIPPVSVIHHCSLLQLYRKQINWSNWCFDLMFCESGTKQSTPTAFIVSLKLTYIETHWNV